MSLFCEYHPTQPAAWDCERCETLLCDECIDVREVKEFNMQAKKYHICPKCNQEVTWLGISNILPPFWNRLPRFFVYPFYLKPLALNILICFAMVIFSGEFFYNKIAQFTLWGIWLKYSFAALNLTASGNLNPPDLNQKTLSHDFSIVFKQLGIFIVLSLAMGLVIGTFGPGAGVVFKIAGLFMLPSMVIILVSSQSLSRALNPMAFIGLTIKIGSGYFIMYFFLLALGSAPSILLNTILGYLPERIAPLIIQFAINYYTLISYNLMGYVLLQYHEEIGHEINLADFAKEKTTTQTTEEKPADPLAGEVDMHLKGGNYDQALQILQTEINEKNSTDINMHSRYFMLLELQQNTEAMLKHGKPYLDLLVTAGKQTKACETYILCSDHDIMFAPKAANLAKLAGWLKQSGKIKESIRAYSAFTRLYKQHPMIPNVYFRAAEIFNEKLNQKEKALNMLNALIKNYPNHDIMPYVKQYIKRIS